MKSQTVKYDGTNFKVWLARFRGAAAEKELQQHLTMARPEREGDERNQWDRREEKLRGKLTEWLDDDHLWAHARTCNNQSCSRVPGIPGGARRTGPRQGHAAVCSFLTLHMGKKNQPIKNLDLNRPGQGGGH